MSQKLFVKLNRDEIEWLERRARGELHNCEMIKEKYSAVSNLPPEKQLLVQKAYADHQSLLDTSTELKNMLEQGVRRRVQIQKSREELEWRIECTEDAAFKELFQKELDSLLKEEDYTIELNRESLKNTIEMAQLSEQRLVTQIIPKYESMKEEEFQAPMTKAYYVNDKKWEKNMLQELIKKLEKKL